jgi:integrase
MAPRKARKKKVAAKRQAWNKGLEIGKKDAFTPDQVKRIRSILVKRDASGLRDLALFSTAIDTMLQGRDLLELHVRDVQHRNGSIRSTIKVSKKRSGAPVRCALSRLTAKALEKWIADSGKKPGDVLSPRLTVGRNHTRKKIKVIQRLAVKRQGRRIPPHFVSDDGPTRRDCRAAGTIFFLVGTGGADERLP